MSDSNWNRTTSVVSGFARVIILGALLVGGAKTLGTFRELVCSGRGTTIASSKQRVIAAPSGEVITSISGILKLLIGPSTNSVSSFQEAVTNPADVLLLPVERTEHSPVVLPYISTLAACVLVICAFIWGIVRVWRED